MRRYSFLKVLILLHTIFLLSACVEDKKTTVVKNESLTIPLVSLKKDDFNNLSLQWTAIENVSEYRIHWATSQESTELISFSIDRTQLTVPVTQQYFSEAEVGQLILVSISVKLGETESQKTSPIPVIFPPEKITSLRSETSNGKSNLDWNDTADNYNIYWFPGKSFTLATDVNSFKGLSNPSFIHSHINLTIGESVYYAVSPVAYGIEGPLSDLVEVTVAAPTLASPQNITTTIAGNHIILDWDQVTLAESYKVFRAETNEINDEPYTSVIEPPFTDTNIEREKTYYYWISATKDINESFPSEPTGAVLISAFSGKLTKASGAAIALSEEDYANLTPIQQYKVANNLLATLHKGIPASDFFDLSNGLGSNLKIDQGENYLSNTMIALSEELEDNTLYVNAVKTNYTFSNESRRVTAEPLATIREYPISRDLLEAWMSYVLVNTILFTPAMEMRSVDHVDAHKIYNRLQIMMNADASINDIVLDHQQSQANWRRFSSPENNTRAMIEIYLGLTDRQADIAKTTAACKNWRITDDRGGYQLVVDYTGENTEPQLILDTYWITSCDDFYEVIANHPLTIPHITQLLVDRFFPSFDREKRTEITDDIVSTNPTKFRDIFIPILFSKEYLLNNKRAKSFEETFFNLAERIYWENGSRFLNELANIDRGSSQPSLNKMSQPAMLLKDGRANIQPLDTLSFASYHTAVREQLLAAVNTRWGTWGDTFISHSDAFNLEDYIQYLFISTLARKASTEELETLVSVIETENETRKREQARIVLDYVSRLSEIYFFNSLD